MAYWIRQKGRPYEMLVERVRLPTGETKRVVLTTAPVGEKPKLTPLDIEELRERKMEEIRTRKQGRVEQFRDYLLGRKEVSEDTPRDIKSYIRSRREKFESIDLLVNDLMKIAKECDKEFRDKGCGKSKWVHPWDRRYIPCEPRKNGKLTNECYLLDMRCRRKIGENFRKRQKLNEEIDLLDFVYLGIGEEGF